MKNTVIIVTLLVLFLIWADNSGKLQSFIKTAHGT